MMDRDLFRIYQAAFADGDCLAKATLFLADRPGSLALIANLFAKYGINISVFHYNRSRHPNRVALELQATDAASLERAGEELLSLGLFDQGSSSPLVLGVVDTQSILQMEVQIKNVPGALGRLADLLATHDANVIFMAYDEAVSETSAHISLVTEDTREVDRLLKDLNSNGYYYSLLYRGSEQKEVDDIIGLNLVERFFFRLKKVLGTDDIDRLRNLVYSSQRLTDTLVRFNQEAGKHLEAGKVLTNVLSFATASLNTSGPRFTWRQLPSLPFGSVVFHAFRIPTGGNIHILEADDEAVMIDGGYGHYYDDVKEMLRTSGIDPARIQRIYLTHPDADHAGMSGYFADEFGTQVFLHPDARAIIEHDNRAWGSGSPLLDLNHYFTILVNEFTRFHVPSECHEFGTGVLAEDNGFKVIDTFEISGQTYRVIESAGGHIRGQVFFLSEDSGLIFTGDFLLSVESLSTQDRDILNLPKFMMTSTNADSLLFRQEMDNLKRLVRDFDARLQREKRGALVVPGHGDYYPARKLR